MKIGLKLMRPKEKKALTNGELFQFGKCVAQVFSNSPTKIKEI